MGSRDRPAKEAKKKPKDKSAAQPKLQSLSDTPGQAELIRKERKPRWNEDSSGGSDS